MHRNDELEYSIL